MDGETKWANAFRGVCVCRRIGFVVAVVVVVVAVWLGVSRHCDRTVYDRGVAAPALLSNV